MFENALIGSQGSRRPSRRLLTLPVAVVVHVLALVTAITVQLWAVEEVREPERAIAVYLPPQALPPPPPPPPRGEQAQAAPVARQAVVQPVEVPPDIPPASPGDRAGVEGGLDTGSDEGEAVGTKDGVPGGVPGPTPTPGPEVESPVRLTSVMEAPERTAGPDPIYPEAARQAHREGIVILEAVVERDGTVGAVRVLLDRVGFGAGEAAASAVRVWHYRPARFNGRPRAVIMTVTVTFRID